MRPELSLSVLFLHPRDDQVEARKLILHKLQFFPNCQLPLLQMTAGLTKKTLLCFSRQSYCQKLRDIFSSSIKTFSSSLFVWKSKEMPIQDRRGVRALLFIRKFFFFIFFPDIKAIPFGTKYTWDRFLEGPLAMSSARTDRLLLIFGVCFSL